MTLPLWLEIAIGLLVGIIFIIILSFLIGLALWLIGGNCAVRYGNRMYNKYGRRLMPGGTPPETNPEL